MHNIQDLFISRDIAPVFDNTLNDDARAELNKILLSPLTSIEEIEKRQQILKALLSQQRLFAEYQYRKIEYAEAYKFLLYFATDELKEKDYLAFLFQKKKNNILFGHYAQLIYFFKDLESVLREHIDIAQFPKSYQEEIRFIWNYLNDFKLTSLKAMISKQKLNYKSIQRLNKLIVDKRKNGDTLLFFAKLNLLETYISIAKAIPKLKLNFIEVGSATLQLSAMFHPMVDNVVDNDLQITQNVVLITGANMSGKSTFLKTVGLCVYLAHLGLPVPAQSGRIPFYDYISIQINHSDDLKNGYSHFMNEIVNLKNVLQQIETGKTCFSVFDELFKGTNHEDALAISKKALKGLKKMKNGHFFISTHLSELKEEVQIAEMEAFYIDCIVENGMPMFSYKIKEGWSDLKIGQLLFKKIGLDDMLN